LGPGRQKGSSLAELLAVIGILGTLTAMGVPLVLQTLDGARTRGAAHYMAARLNLARMEAVKRSVYVAMRVEQAGTSYACTFYADGNGNGVRTDDISRGVDRAVGPSERLEDHFAGVSFGIVADMRGIDGSTPLEAGTDPIRFGRGDLVSFSPSGTATAGTFYIRGQGKQQAAVRVLGTTGRVRVLVFDFATGHWVMQ
jgi:Tfp pilus assembly protein FimT